MTEERGGSNTHLFPSLLFICRVSCVCDFYVKFNLFLFAIDNAVNLRVFFNAIIIIIVGNHYYGTPTTESAAQTGKSYL